MDISFKNISTCILMENGKTTLCKKLKNEYKVYCLEKSNIDIKDPIIDDESKIGYIKGLIKKIGKSQIIVIDDLSEIFNYNERVKIFEYLKKNNIKVIYLTSNVEDVVNFPYTMIIYKRKVAIEGYTKLVLEEEKLMKVLGYSLPFYVNLSIQLKYYGLLDKICFNKKELEETLWK